MVATRPMAVLEIQTAVQAKLLGDATLSGMITGVFDQVPQNKPLPYISYGQHVDGPYPTFGGHWNSEAYFLLDIWSNASGDDECYRILAEVLRLLATRPDNLPLTLPSYGHVGMWYEWSTILHEEDYGIRHMPVRFLSRAVET